MAGVTRAACIVELVEALPRGGSGKMLWRELQDREFARHAR